MRRLLRFFGRSASGPDGVLYSGLSSFPKLAPEPGHHQGRTEVSSAPNTAAIVRYRGNRAIQGVLYIE